MIESDRLISGSDLGQEEIIDRAIRPTKLADYRGQPQVQQQMEVFIQAARQRSEALDVLC